MGCNQPDTELRSSWVTGQIWPRFTEVCSALDVASRPQKGTSISQLVLSGIQTQRLEGPLTGAQSPQASWSFPKTHEISPVLILVPLLILTWLCLRAVMFIISNRNHPKSDHVLIWIVLIAVHSLLRYSYIHIYMYIYIYMNIKSL